MKPALFEDEYYLRCISLARLSKGQGERYGSLLVKDGHTIGMGYNRAIAHPSFHLERLIRMGQVNHAEIEAMNDALKVCDDLEGSDIYCAGYFPKPDDKFQKPNHLMIRSGAYYTCFLCLPHMRKYKISSICVPTEIGWAQMTLDQASASAELFRDNRHEMRRKIVSTSYTLDDIAGSLVDLESIQKTL